MFYGKDFIYFVANEEGSKMAEICLRSIFIKMKYYILYNWKTQKSAYNIYYF